MHHNETQRELGALKNSTCNVKQFFTTNWIAKHLLLLWSYFYLCLKARKKNPGCMRRRVQRCREGWVCGMLLPFQQRSDFSEWCLVAGGTCNRQLKQLGQWRNGLACVGLFIQMMLGFFPPTFFLLFVTHGGSVGTNNRALCFVPKACLSSGLKWHSFVCVTVCVCNWPSVSVLSEMGRLLWRPRVPAGCLCSAAATLTGQDGRWVLLALSSFTVQQLHSK